MTVLPNIAFSPKPRGINYSPCALAKTLDSLRVILIGHNGSDAQTLGSQSYRQNLLQMLIQECPPQGYRFSRLHVRPWNLNFNDSLVFLMQVLYILKMTVPRTVEQFWCLQCGKHKDVCFFFLILFNQILIDSPQVHNFLSENF